MIFRPFNLGIGTCAIIGAVLSLVCGTVSFGDTLEAFSIVWDASLAFLGIIIFSLVLECGYAFFGLVAYGWLRDR